MSKAAKEIAKEERETTHSGSAAIPELPALGFRNYWYPIIEARRVGRRPIPVRILGEDIVLFPGKGGKVAALLDRCPHRGTMLSRGRILFPGTLSCGYHGWTYNEQGECVAAIVEGPESRLPGQVRVRAYPTEERFGIVWAFMGEGEPPPLEEDLPPEVLEPNVLPLFFFEEWKCDWRNITENIIDSAHPAMVHRTSFNSLFQEFPACATKYPAELLPDGKGVVSKATGVRMQAEYPGLGKFPARYWWRVIKVVSGAMSSGLVMRMPGYVVVKRRDPYFGIWQSNWQWPFPVDEHRARILLFTITHPKSLISRLALKLLWWIYHKPSRVQFVRQDRYQLEPQNYRNPERLSPASDSGVILFRNYAAKFARKPGSTKGPTSAGEVDENSSPKA
ncbi:MAG: Rieske 2Fe-2S domain-containing protein [Deltaproteobacteria bacterium]|nr:Rieske 2Fe-2S domain-containing protein [Deltaproteobacteria bacterium]